MRVYRFLIGFHVGSFHRHGLTPEPYSCLLCGAALRGLDALADVYGATKAHNLWFATKPSADPVGLILSLNPRHHTAC
jgi:hypothetical protein